VQTLYELRFVQLRVPKFGTTTYVENAKNPKSKHEKSVRGRRLGLSVGSRSVLKGGEGGRTTVGEGGAHGLLREDSTKRGGG
jgi:hypothetical protein